MKRGPTANVLTAQCASPGLAKGPIWLDARREGEARRALAPDAEADALRVAITAAVNDLSFLREHADELASEILEYQIAMLEDDELTATAFPEIADGAAADNAWVAAIGAQIAVYQDGDSVYFRARAADLEDLRDRVLDHLRGSASVINERVSGHVVVAGDMTPSRFLALASHGIAALVLRAGSASSHVAILARARGIPMLVGLGDTSGEAVQDADCALVDAQRGTLMLDPNAEEQGEFGQRLANLADSQREQARLLPLRATTRRGTSCTVMVNIDDPDLLASIDIEHCDGSGLVRTELQLDDGGNLPDEAEQTRIYRQVMAWSRGKPVVFRTLDAGGDKPIPGLTRSGEANPFLGVRGLRLSLERPDVFQAQIRAMLRAAGDGDMRIMLPMVTAPEEFETARRLITDVHAAMAPGERPVELPPIGIMVEVPAAALRIAAFDADFYSVGSNDLIQYTTATSRDEASLRPLQDPRNPAVLELIARVVEHGDGHNKGVSLCGDMASDPGCLADLIGLGMRSLSVAPAALGPIKARIHELDI
ncbi:MAG: phosphoenolpyruvate--protein phosphotransferase [Pseudomonadota bacterium]